MSAPISNPSGVDRAPRIGLYGRMNAGKSSLLNRLTGQSVALVSEQPGTTTDPVRRSFEIADFGTVVFIDTAGFDDAADPLGRARTAKTVESLMEIDLAVVLLLGPEPDSIESAFIDRLGDKPRLLLAPADLMAEPPVILCRIAERLRKIHDPLPPFFGDRFIEAGEVILLVCPLDGAAPAGRLILPQVQALRAALDLGAMALVVQPDQLPKALKSWPSPRLVVTDSQYFQEVARLVPSGVELTSFSILLAEQKGDTATYTAGLAAVETLRAGDHILILENCSHQVTCDDIGRTKIPAWLRQHTGLDSLKFTVVSGRDPMPTPLDEYALAVQCGGCVSTRQVIQSRIRACVKAGVPITNYGLLIRHLRVAPQ